MDGSDLAIVEKPFDAQVVVDRQKQRAKSKTPGAKKKVVVKGSKGKFNYIKAQAALEWLEDNFVVLGIEEVADSVKTNSNWLEAAVKIIVADKVTGVRQEVQRYGACEAVPKSGGLSVPPIKAAMSDAIKRVCVALGGFRDIYGELEAEDVDQVSPKELVWYIDTIIPITKERFLYKGDIDSFLKQMFNFINKKVSVDELCKAYQLINPFNKETHV